ncbi:MAG TPA: GNAT family N-acetyltransferase [Roseiflexaceae bacterium]|nr:GNAT family N-acetyltransferase [Roseiflexaceae bacterium]
MPTITPVLPATTRLYENEHDLAAIVELMRVCEVVDHLQDTTTLAELRDEYAQPWFNPRTNVRLWFDAGDQLVAAAELWPPQGALAEANEPRLFMWYKVHPDFRGGLLEQRMLAWASQHVAMLVRQHQMPIKLGISLTHVEAELEPMLLDAGFTQERAFFRMERSLATIAAPRFPEGFTCRAGELSAEGYVALHNDVWVDHFGYEPWTVDVVNHYRSEATYDAGLDMIAYAPDGTPAGFCWSSMRHQESPEQARYGHIGLLGVRREYRKRRLGQALLREAMQRLRERGASMASLGVDAASPTGATRLYAAEGFATAFTRTTYMRRFYPNE